MKEIESKTSAKIITDTFVRIFLIFSLLITIIVSGIVAFTSLQIRKSEGAALLNSVQTAATNGQVNWDELKKTKKLHLFDLQVLQVKEKRVKEQQIF